MNYFEHFHYIHLKTTHNLSYLVLMHTAVWMSVSLPRITLDVYPNSKTTERAIRMWQWPSSPQVITSMPSQTGTEWFPPLHSLSVKAMVVEVPSWKQTLDFYGHQTCRCDFLTSRTIKNNFYYLIGESVIFIFIFLRINVKAVYLLSYI